MKHADETCNIESYKRHSTHIDIITKRSRYGDLYYVIHCNYLKKSGKWENGTLLVKHNDIHALTSLMHKSKLFSASIPQPKFETAKQLLRKKRVIPDA
jgi:hypothetical protein